jgi:hypothetical protein
VSAPTLAAGGVNGGVSRPRATLTPGRDQHRAPTRASQRTVVAVTEAQPDARSLFEQLVALTDRRVSGRFKTTAPTSTSPPSFRTAPEARRHL